MKKLKLLKQIRIGLTYFVKEPFLIFKWIWFMFAFCVIAIFMMFRTYYYFLIGKTDPIFQMDKEIQGSAC